MFGAQQSRVQSKQKLTGCQIKAKEGKKTGIYRLDTRLCLNCLQRAGVKSIKILSLVSLLGRTRVGTVRFLIDR